VKKPKDGRPLAAVLSDLKWALTDGLTAVKKGDLSDALRCAECAVEDARAAITRAADERAAA
jgi:hypothetical protein